MRGPQRFQDRDFFLHQRIALFLGVADAFGFDLAFVLPRDQIDANAPARHLVEGRDHFGHQDRIDIAGPCCDQRLDLGRAGGHEGARDPGLPAGRADGDQEIFEAGLFGRVDHARAEFGRARDLRFGKSIGRGVAMRGQIPAKFERTHGVLRKVRFAENQSTACGTSDNRPLPISGQSAKWSPGCARSSAG